MRFNDAVIGVVLILFALAMIAYTQTFPGLYGQQFGPDLFPVVIGVGLLGCGIVLTVSGIASRHSVPLVDWGQWAGNRAAWINLILVIAALVFYILASGALGFIPTSMIILVTLLLRFGVGPFMTIAVAAVTTLVIHQIFSNVLLVPLPWGILQPIAW
jgi:putative tricarboxylic transport membrane protein